MAISFNSLKAEVLVMLNALAATTPATLQSAFTSAVSGTVANLSTDWPEAQIEDVILDAEYQLCVEIARSDRHPERADFEESSVALTSGAILPIASASGKPFIGDYSAVIDGTTGFALLERPLSLVQMVIENEQSMFPVPLRIYSMAGARLYFKTPAGNTAKVTGPALARATWTGNIRCRDSHALAIVSGAMAYLLTKEGAWGEAQQMHAQIWVTHLAQIQGIERQTAVPLPSQT